MSEDINYEEKEFWEDNLRTKRCEEEDDRYRELRLL